MPKKKKSKPAPQGLSPQQVAQANQQGLRSAIDAVPILQFDDMMGNFGDFTNSITDPFTQLFNSMIGREGEDIGMAPLPEPPPQPASEPVPEPPPPQTGGQVAQPVPQTQQPYVPPGAAGQFQGVNLTPEQMASIQKFNRYGRGMA